MKNRKMRFFKPRIVGFLVTVVFAKPVSAFVTAGAVSGDATKMVVTQQAMEKSQLNLPFEVDVIKVNSIRNQSDVQIIDVREQWEYDEGHVPGAQRIPLGQLQERLSEVSFKKTVIMVCRSGNRSKQATRLLRAKGYYNVQNMDGGMNAWSSASFEVAK